MTTDLTGAEAPMVLVVDDEPHVRRICAAVLRRQGYAVLEAGSAREAVAAAGHAGDIDLLLVDVSLPDAGGRELADHLEALRPGLRVLYCSGHDPEALAEGGHVPPGAALLRKPFHLAAVLAAVSRALGTPC